MYRRVLYYLVPLFLFLPSFVYGTSSYTMNCTDFAGYSTSGTVSCSGSTTLNLTHNAGGGAGINTAPSNYHLADNTVYYVSATYSGSGNVAITLGGDNAGASYFTASGSFTDHAFTYPNGNTANTGTLQIYDGNSAVCSGAACTFDGTLTNVCIADAVGVCSGGGTTGGGDTATSTVDKAIDATYYGYILFIAGFWGIIWFFKRR